MKLTRKSYNRRIYTFGTLVFLSIALMSTGFATWIMSKDASQGQDGNVTMGTITDGELSFKDVAFSATNYSFEPEKDDVTGEVIWDGTNYANLTINVTGKVSPAKYVGALSVNLSVNDSDTSDPTTKVKTNLMKAAGLNPTTGEKDPSLNEYITLPACFNTDIQLQETTNYTVANDEITFTYDVSFGWGTYFGKKNPSVYLDENSFTYDEKKEMLIGFKRTLYGLPVVPEGSTDNDSTYTDKEVMDFTSDALKFNLTVKATANVTNN